MKKFTSTLILAGTVILSVVFIAATDTYYFKINKSFEIFGEIFRYISTNYVEEIDPEELMQAGIDGMLSRLDPYTTFYPLTESEDIDLLTSGTYTGLGITVGIKDKMLTVIGVRDGYSAQKNGMRIGDRIYKIDTSIILNSTTKDLRIFTRGVPGSKVDVWILRDGISDTLHYTLTREVIKVNNVSYSDFISDGIAYLKLERFSRNSAEEVRLALNKLMNRDSIKSVILDLRDNPGGLLEAAVSVTELFVPKGKLIVSTKGRNQTEGYSYYSLQKPLLPDVPLAVIINENSASASEIVAGAIQDLDRGIIIGRKSYGKGLVQSVFELPYRTSLKMTTSKYYTPSGRCIQRLELLDSEYADAKSRDESSTKEEHKTFFTANGREVNEYIGIIPDTTIKPIVYTDYSLELLKHDVIFDFANKYSSSFESLPSDFLVNKKIFREFEEFVASSKIKYESMFMKGIDDLESQAESQNLPKIIERQINDLKESVRSFEKDLINKNEKEINDLLFFEISSRFRTNEELVKLSLELDTDIKAASQLLESKSYRKILATDDIESKTKNH